MQAIGLLIFARTLGPAEYAIIVAATAVAVIAAEFVGFGAGDLLIREVSRNPASHRSAFGRALRLVGLTIVPAIVLATVVAMMWFRTDASFAVLLVLVGSEVIAARVVFMTEQIAIAHHETHAANANRIFATAVRFGVICFAVFVARISTATQWAPYAALSAVVAGGGCLLLVGRRFGAPDLRAPFGSELHIGVMFTLMQVLRAVLFSMDKFAVGWIAPAATVGSFGVASRIAQLGNLPTIAITRITYPTFFAEGAKGLGAAVAFGKKIAPAVILVALVSSAGLLSVALVLPHLLGIAFSAARPFLLLMLLMPLAAGFQNLFGDILSGADFQRQRVIAGGIGLVLTSIAIVVGIDAAGIMGAVIGYMIGHFLFASISGLIVAHIRRARPS